MKHEIVQLRSKRGRASCAAPRAEQSECRGPARLRSRWRTIAACIAAPTALLFASLVEAQPMSGAGVLATESGSALYGFPLFVSACMATTMLFEQGMRRALGRAVLRWALWLFIPLVMLLVEGLAGPSMLTIVFVVVSPWIFFLLLLWGLIASV